jgi:hypothetical protein
MRALLLLAMCTDMNGMQSWLRHTLLVQQVPVPMYIKKRQSLVALPLARHAQPNSISQQKQQPTHSAVTDTLIHVNTAAALYEYKLCCALSRSDTA